MSRLGWNPAKSQDAEFVGQCMRDEERRRLERLTGQPARLAFVGVYNGALGSSLLRVGGQPVGMLCGNPCSTLGLRTAFLALTPQAALMHALDAQAMQAAREYAQGDAFGMVAMAELGDTTQARWLQALGFHQAPAAWTDDLSAGLFYAVKQGAELTIREFFDNLATGSGSLTTWH